MVKAHEEKKQNNKKNTPYKILKLLIIVLIVIGFLTSIAWFSINKTTQKKEYSEYNKFPFIQSGEFWITRIGRDGVAYDATFYAHPLDLEEMYFEEWARTLTLQRRHSDIVLAVAPESDNKAVLAGVNVGRITGKFYGVPTSSAFYVPLDERANLNITHPMIDCSEATEMRPVIWIWPEGDITGVTISKDNPNCIIISSTTPDEINAVADLYTYKILRIMD